MYSGHSIVNNKTQVFFSLVLLSTYLWTEITEGCFARVMNGDRLHSTKDNIFGYLNTKATHPRDQNVGVGHFAHGFMAKHIAVRVKHTDNCQFK